METGTSHLSPETLQRYRSRSLSGPELLDLDGHLAACAECRARLRDPDDLTRAASLLIPPAQETHLDFDTLVALAEDALPHSQRAPLRDHLDRCPQCAAELANLREARIERLEEAASAPQPDAARDNGGIARFFRGPWLLVPSLAGAVAAVALFVIQARVGVPSGGPRQGPLTHQASVPKLDPINPSFPPRDIDDPGRAPIPPRSGGSSPPASGGIKLERFTPSSASSSPSPRRPSSASQIRPVRRTGPGGSSSPRHDDSLLAAVAGEKLPAEVRTVLASGKLELPSGMRSLVAPAPVRMGAAAGLRILSPVATAVTETRPRLRWTAVEGATHYTVALADRTEGSALPESGKIIGTEWIPDPPLTPGHDYEWEVRVYHDEELLGTAPAPPHRAARFRVLDPAAVRKLEAELEKHAGSPLTRAVLYTRAGLLDAAEQELAGLRKQHPDSPVLRRLEASLRGTRSAPLRRRRGSLPGDL